jgi:alpha-1,3-rhamnosyl/mannosyltransferase
LTNPANATDGLRIGLSVRMVCNPALEGRVDGLGVYTRQLWRQFAAMSGVEVHPVVGFGSRNAALAARHPHGFAFPLNYGASGALAILAGMHFPGTHQLAHRIDVYHATDYWIPKLAGVPVVASLHDAIPLTHPQWGTPKHRALKNHFLRVAAHWADSIITVSAAMVPVVVEQFRVSPARVTVIHNGVGDEWFERIAATKRSAILAKHRLSPGFFLTVGTLQPRKNLARLLASFRNLPDSVRRERPLVIVGRMGWGVDELLPAIRAAQAAGEVHWLDYLPDDELRAVFQSARALVFPSLAEGFGLPVVEAFASGTPVLTSNVSALPEIAGDAALQVDPRDVDAIRESMLQLAVDADLCARLAAAGSLRATKFSWRTCAEQVLKVYRDVA